MQRPEGVGGIQYARSGYLIMRLTDQAGVLLEGAPDVSSQPALRQSFREWINRRDPVEVNRVFLTIFDHLGFGMIDRAWPKREDLAKHKHAVPLSKVVLHVGQVPPAAMQARGAIIENEF